MAKTKAKQDVVFNGEKYKVPIIRLNSPEEDKLEVGELICMVYSYNTHSIDGACKLFGVGRTTFYSWREKYEQLEQSFNRALVNRKAIYAASLTEQAMTSAERLLSTKPYKTRTIKYSLEGVTKDQLLTLYNGGDLPDNKLFNIEVSDSFQEKPPNTAATLSVLYNQAKAEFEKNPKAVEDVSQQTSIPVQTWVDSETGQGEEDEINKLLGDGSD